MRGDEFRGGPRRFRPRHGLPGRRRRGPHVGRPDGSGWGARWIPGGRPFRGWGARHYSAGGWRAYRRGHVSRRPLCPLGARQARRAGHHSSSHRPRLGGNGGTGLFPGRQGAIHGRLVDRLYLGRQHPPPWIGQGAVHGGLVDVFDLLDQSLDGPPDERGPGILVRYVLDRLYLLTFLQPGRDGYPRLVRAYRYPVIRSVQRGRVDGGVGFEGVDRGVDETRLHAHVHAGDRPAGRLRHDRLGLVRLGLVRLGRVRLGRVRSSDHDLFRCISLAAVAAVVGRSTRVTTVLLLPLIERIPAPLRAGSVAFEQAQQLFGKWVVVASVEIVSHPSAYVIICVSLCFLAFRFGIIIWKTIISIFISSNDRDSVRGIKGGIDIGDAIVTIPQEGYRKDI